MPSDYSGFAAKFPDHSVSIYEGSIAAVPGQWDVVVSSDDNYLSHSGGASRAIWTKAGVELQEQHGFLASQGLKVGDTLETKAYAFPAKGIYHVVTLDLDTYEAISAEGLRELYTEIMDRAEQNGHLRILFPLLATGAAGHDQQTSCNSLIEAIKWRMDDARVPLELHLATLATDTALTDLHDQLSTAARDTSSFTTLLNRLTQRDWKPREKAAIATISGEINRIAKETQDTPSLAACSLFEHSLAITKTCLQTHGKFSKTPLDSLKRSHRAAFQDLLEVAKSLNLPCPAPVRQKVEEAIRARNLVVHSLDATQSDALRTVMAGARALLEWSESLYRQPNKVLPRKARPALKKHGDGMSLKTAALIGGASVLPLFGLFGTAIGTAIFGTKCSPSKPRQRRITSNQEAPQAGQRSVADPQIVNTVATANKAVRELARFIRTAFDAKLLEQLYHDLDRDNYRGDRDLQITEFCARHNKLANLLTRLGSIKLRSEAEKWMGRKLPDEDMQETADQLLTSMGFAIPPSIHGLEYFSQEITRLERQVEHAEATEITGAVARGSGLLERICLDLLQYLGQRAYQTAAEVLCKEKAWLEPTYQLAKCGLGKRIELLGRLLHEISNDNRPQVKLIKESLDLKKLKMTTSTLTPLRKSIVHFEREGDSMCVEDRRVAARTFLSAASDFLEQIGPGGQGLYPLIIVINKISYDIYGRRIVDAVDGNGLPEHIFTDMDVRPGRAYFMKPFSNPVRVDPFLMEAPTYSVKMT